MSTFIQAMCAGVLLAMMPGSPAVRADHLRNVKPGQEMPVFSLPTLRGGTISASDLKGKTVILVFLSAQQRNSEDAAASARSVHRDLGHEDVALVFVTADTARTPYFRHLRDATGFREPLGLDFDRGLYGDAGLIVLPTTIVIDRDWKLAHVISAYKSDYEHVLEACVRHALGLISDDELEGRLKTETFRRNRPLDKVARHRAAAKLLRKSGLLDDAENELRAALQIDPNDAQTRLDLASLCLAADRVAEADEVVAGVLEADPHHLRGKLIYGIVLYRGECLDEAEQVLREALVLNPDPAPAHYYLGLILERKGETTDALEHYKQSLARLLKDRPL
ncbi:MAG: peroxiredoxin family protein [Planctomycetota bacterium]|jgi:tetratricopeptide (TPR) repeat protein